MFLIRQATLTDVETIRQLAHEIWWPTYSPILAKEQIVYMLDALYSTVEITQQIDQKIQYFLLLIEDEKPVAFAAYGPLGNYPEAYKLHKLYCLPSTQGKGYGKALLEEISNKARAAGITILELNVNRYNNARHFYEKMGFTVAYTIDIPFDKYFLNDYVMRKEL